MSQPCAQAGWVDACRQRKDQQQEQQELRQLHSWQLPSCPAALGYIASSRAMDSCCALRAECRYKTGPAIAIRIAQAQLPLLHLLCIEVRAHLPVYLPAVHIRQLSAICYRYLYMHQHLHCAVHSISIDTRYAIVCIDRERPVPCQCPPPATSAFSLYLVLSLMEPRPPGSSGLWCV